MATAEKRLILSHIRKLVATHQANQVPDQDLLRRFADERDEAAFATLLHRHGPMVLRVCRRVLHNWHDAEDAFQATFLTLARRARAIRKQASVASWLHGVAYRVSLQANANGRRMNISSPSSTDKHSGTPDDDVTWRELRSILDAELNRLPEKYRAPLLLCYLEGQTRDEAAQSLGCPLGTLKSRLERGRDLLRGRLTRRGLTLSAALVGIGLEGSTASAALPGALARSTVQAAVVYASGKNASALVSAQAAKLLKAGLQATTLGKMKIATMALAGCFLFAGVGIFTHRATAAKSISSDNRHLAALAAPNAEVNDRAPVPGAGNDQDKEVATFRGRVVDPAGNPVAGAKLFLSSFREKDAPSGLRATTGADGRFEFVVKRPEIDLIHGGQPWSFFQVVATATGFGPDWTKAGDGAERELTLRLVRDDVPIRGRVLDLQGKPVANAVVRILDLETTPEENLTPYLQGWTSGQEQSALNAASKVLSDPSVAGLPKTLKTGADGSVLITGAGRERIIKVSIEGPSIESAVVRVIPRPATDLKSLTMPRRPTQMFPALRSPAFYSALFDHVAGPAKLITGTVRDKETGKPIAGVQVQGSSDDGWWENSVRATTDAQGRYRLIGLAKSKAYRLRVWPETDKLYLPRGQEVSGTEGLNAITVDFEMVRGVQIHGRITDKATGKPLRTGLRYVPLQGNTHPATDYFRSVSQGYEVKRDGTFQFIAPPGPGVLFATVWPVNGEYHYCQARLQPADRDKAYKESELGDAFLGIGGSIQSLHGVNAYRLVNPPAEGTSESYDMQLDPGLSKEVTILDPSGHPLAGTTVTGRMAFWSQPKAAKTPKFTVESLEPAQPRELLFAHLERGFGGHLTLRGDEKSAATVKLEPFGKIGGRFVDEDGQPMAGVRVDLFFTHRYIRQPIHWWNTGRDEITTDREGRFQIEKIIPGLKLSLSAVSEGKFLTLGDNVSYVPALTPGEAKNLGDIKAKPGE